MRRRQKHEPMMLYHVDLFCGGGGNYSGYDEACNELGLPYRSMALNHSPLAVATMRANYPNATVLDVDLVRAVPSKVCTFPHIDLLWASPSCTHHSRARGGKPRDDQERVQPDLVLPWLDEKFVKHMIVENVEEITEWGPLGADGKPLKSKIGACFRAWVAAIEARNYIVEWRVLNCADYGDATTRRRFFLQAVRRGCGRIVWPEPTHSEHPEQMSLFGNKVLKPWRGIRECLDLSDTGRSIFGRKKPLSKNTMRKIAVGLRRYCGLDFQMDMLGSNSGDESRVRSLDDPLPTQHASGNRTAVVTPFLVRLNRNSSAQDLDTPLGAVMAGGQHHALINPCIIKMRSNATAGSVDDPLTTITGGTTNHYLCTPFVVNNNTNNVPRRTDKPIHALTTGNHAMLCQPLIMDHCRGGKATPGDKPMPTQTTHDRMSVVTPLVLGQQGCAACRPVSEPCPTISTSGAVRMVTPVIVDMSRPGGADSGHVRPATEPLQTITTCDAFQGVFPVLEDGRLLDIRIRMLKPSELAAAHSFRKGYIFAGNRTEQVRQIGNSVPVRTSKALCLATMTG